MKLKICWAMIASQMVLHLGLGQYSLVHSRHSSSSTSQKRKSMFLSGIELLGLQNSNRNGWAVNGAGKDSEFEVDPDKAREALRKLDEQLQSLSNKQINPPKIRGVAAELDDEWKEEDNEWKVGEEAGSSKLSASFLAYGATLLLIFTIVYNVVFITVIKPSVDGPDMSTGEEGEEYSLQPSLSRSAQFLVRR